MRTPVLPCALVSICALAHAVQAQNTPATRASLRGLPGVALTVEPFSAEAQRDGLSERALRAAVETRLRKAGIRILTRQQQMQTPQRPALEVRAALSKLATGEYLYSVHFECTQWVASLANPEARVAAATPLPAKTWSSPNAFGIAPAKEIAAAVQNAVETMADEFVAAYANANRGDAAAKSRRDGVR